MKKFPFILLNYITITAFAQTPQRCTRTGNETARIKANAATNIVTSIKIIYKQDLNFREVSNNTAGKVIVSNTGDISESTLTQIGTTSPSSTSFDVTASNGFQYSVTLPETATISNGTDEITIDNFNHNAVADTTGNGIVQTFGVGPTLNGGEGQATGNYTGTFYISVAYQ